MRLRELSGGLRICPEIRLDSPLYTHNETALYLATDSVMKHTLVHVIAKETSSYETLEKAAHFHREHLSQECRIGEYEEFYFFAEPFPLGEYMFEWLERRERVSLAEALKRTIALLKVLQVAHENGIYHGRITPQSVLLERTGDDLALKMMGLGVAQALNESIRSDIDWFDYTFDLEGMSPAAVDIYGVAIILMGLVSGENGIDSFEATGLLPPPLRNGIIQQAMERALALRIDAYANVLTFSQDLEAALLETDERQGEMYVGDLVGFESAVRSVTAVTSRDSITSENSGVWSSLIGTLEQEEKSSLLCSLTSLTALKPVGDEEDEDITRISSLPKQVLSMQRIKAVHAHEEDTGETTITAAPNTELSQPKSELSFEEKLQTPSGSMSTEERMASLQSLEAELKGDMEEEEDESPTRVMTRPNYATISFVKDTGPKGVNSAIEDVINTNKEADDPAAQMEKRIREAVVTEMTMTLGHDVIYRDDDPVAFPPEDEIAEPTDEDVTGNKAGSVTRNAAQSPATPKRHASAQAGQTNKPQPRRRNEIIQSTMQSPESMHEIKSMTDRQKSIVRVLVIIVALLALAVVIIKIANLGG